MPQFRVSEAAELLGVSDDTVRRWTDSGKLPAGSDYAGKLTIDGQVLAAFVVAAARAVEDERGSQVSARNRFVGLVTDVRVEGLVAQVQIQSGPNHFVSLITADAARSLGIEVGSRAVATIKATNVGVEIDS